MLKKQIEIARIVINYNFMNPDSAITVDIVNNNWKIFYLNSDTMEFDVRLNDIAQPLFKKIISLLTIFLTRDFLSFLHWARYLFNRKYKKSSANYSNHATF